MAVRTLKGSIFPVLAAFLASCGERAVPAPAEAEPHTTWQAQCLQDMAKHVDREIGALQAAVPAEGVEWAVTVELDGGDAVVTFVPRREPSIRGGGGEYRFLCADKRLELVQGYR